MATLFTTRMFRAAAVLGWGLGLALAAPTAGAQTNAAPAKWEAEIKAFEAADKTNPPPSGAILFVGSSSIRLWKTLARDFPEYQVINRGFGGSEIADSIVFAERIVLLYRPRMVVLYAGDNDLAAGKSPEQVAADFKTFAQKVRTTLPHARLAFLSVKPSPSRWHLLEKIKAANHMIETLCRREDGLIYIDVFNPMLGADGKPRAELFAADKLHLNARGYALWTALIRPHLKG